MRGFLPLFLLLTTVTFATEARPSKASGPKTEVGLFLLSHQREADSVAETFNATAAGAYVGYRTRSIGGAFLDMKFLSVNPVESKENIEASLLFDESDEGIDSLIGAYVGMVEGNNLLKIGRHELDTPLLNGDATLMLPYAYSGWQYLWDNSLGNKITMGQVNAQKAPDERYFSEISPSGDISNGVSYLGFEEESESGLGGKLYLYRGEKLYDTFYLEATDSYDVGDVTVLAGLQYVKTAKNGSGELIDPSKQDGGDDVELTAGRLGLKYSIFGLLVAYSVNNGDDGLGRAYGGYADLFTTTMLTDLPAYGGPETTSVRFKFDWLPNASSRVIVNSVSYREDSHPDMPTNITDDYTSRYADLKIDLGEGAELYFQYEDVQGELDQTDRTECRAGVMIRF